jgi:thiol:disulfide interchange protein DsbD
VTRRLRLSAATVVPALLCVFFAVPRARAADKLPFQPFTTEAFDSARQQGRPFVVEFSADWCTPCKEMHERTFTDPRVLDEAEGFTFLTVDMTTSTRRSELLLQSFGVIGAPTTLFFGHDGKERARRIGFIGPEDFAKLLAEIREAAGEPKRAGKGFAGQGV